ncbi:sialate O-acetylesterase [Sphingomonas piscis]|uniref:Sialate O-acetylesterase n=1 Tax=Sphingomonas piscis TaxID=2714943 RepID=A0A6G7YN75_9SPHN|nr:sialate O-acetylesterase [Sphingomonas piscis]QIK78192.1 sialate O-acetylesterase [Sphingomonas piscis]
MRVRSRLTTFAALLGGITTPAFPAPTLHPLISDHAVLQRGTPLRIYGTATPGERLTVALGDGSRSIRADKQGRWLAELPAMQAGGPYSLQVTGANGATASAQDVMIGDVWLCSGQSNMEFGLAQSLGSFGAIMTSADEQLRITTIAKKTSINPETSFGEAPKWDLAGPKTVPDFSAACYFMGRDLRGSQKVPIGLIDSTWGGTPIRAWMNEAAVESVDGKAATGLISTFRRDPAAAQRQLGQDFGTWWRAQSGDSAGREPWLKGSALNWAAIPNVGFFSTWGADWSGFTGAIWLRRTVSLTAAQAAAGGTLSLGVVDDMDQTFVNGVGVGNTNDWGAERTYKIAPGILKAGENEIIVFARNSWGPGGLAGPAEKLKLTFADGSTQPLGDGWQFAKVDPKIGAPPSAPWSGPNGAATLYNAMIAPLGPMALKGAAWYQGETDVDTPSYDRRLAALFGTWRKQFRDPNLPAIVVGLAGYGPMRSTPFDSGWARLASEQRAFAQTDAHAAFVPAIDLGEPDDIHPTNKLELGRRLALAARTIAYADTGGKLSPLPLRATRTGDAVTITFSKPLQALSGKSAIGFELCGETQASCRFADARVSGSTVTIPGDGQPATRVRFAWNDYPVINLYDTDLLPASSFELPIN